ncbi:MAG: hypothetical protein DI578_15825, partial [Ectopseudomonas oleovorans]
SERTVGNQTSLERRYYISSLAPDAERIAHAIRVKRSSRSVAAKMKRYAKRYANFFIEPINDKRPARWLT